MNNKLLLGALAGAVTSFLLGWIVWGGFMMDYMSKNIMVGLYRSEEEMMSTMWAAILATLVLGLMYSLIVGKWAGCRNFMSGLQVGAVVGFLFGVSMGFGMWSYTNMYTSMTPMFIELILSALMAALSCGVVGWVWGMGKAAE